MDGILLGMSPDQLRTFDYQAWCGYGLGKVGSMFAYSMGRSLRLGAYVTAARRFDAATALKEGVERALASGGAAVVMSDVSGECARAVVTLEGSKGDKRDQLESVIEVLTLQLHATTGGIPLKMRSKAKRVTVDDMCSGGVIVSYGARIKCESNGSDGEEHPDSFEDWMKSALPRLAVEQVKSTVRAIIAVRDVLRMKHRTPSDFVGASASKFATDNNDVARDDEDRLLKVLWALAVAGASALKVSYNHASFPPTLRRAFETTVCALRTFAALEATEPSPAAFVYHWDLLPNVPPDWSPPQTAADWAHFVRQSCAPCLLGSAEDDGDISTLMRQAKAPQHAVTSRAQRAPRPAKRRRVDADAVDNAHKSVPDGAFICTYQ